MLIYGYVAASIWFMVEFLSYDRRPDAGARRRARRGPGPLRRSRLVSSWQETLNRCGWLVSFVADPIRGYVCESDPIKIFPPLTWL